MSFGPATKPSDREVEAAIAAFLATHTITRPVAPKPIAKREPGPIVMVRRAAAPIKSSVTVGYSVKSLRDAGNFVR